VKPTSGGGIYTGLIGARHCARVAVAALQEGDLSASYLARYQEGWRRELGGEMERGRDLRRVFLSLSDEDLDRLLAILRSPRLRRLVALYGDIDFPSRVFLRLVLVKPFLATFVRVALRFPWQRLLPP